MEAEFETCVPNAAELMCMGWLADSLGESCAMCVASVVPALPLWFASDGSDSETDHDSDSEMDEVSRAQSPVTITDLYCYESFDTFDTPEVAFWPPPIAQE